MIVARALPLLLLAISTAASAATPDDELCRNGLFTVQPDPIELAVITPGGRSWFLEDMDGCPSAESRCRQRAYVVAGDRVLTGRTRGRYVCVYYPSRGGGTAGWMDSARIRRIAVDRDPPISAWLGRWSEDGNPTVRFVRRGTDLEVEGEAYWPSRNPPADFPGGPNEGSIGGIVRVSGNVAHEAECNIRFTLLGDLLVVADPDRNCGGMNVSFSGVYRRERR